MCAGCEGEREREIEGKVRKEGGGREEGGEGEI